MSRIAKAAGVALGTGAVVISGAGLAMADAGAHGAAVGSPGVLSGNAVQVPIHVPINVCGNSVSVIGLLNPAFGNTCANVSDHKGKDGNSGPGGHHGSNGSNGDTGYGS
ncbi:chaplin [Streptomyces sp. NBC_01352]|uniref:Chaplin ChpF n=1 Tax=Streptomyces plumbiresistens TaxID=511811 RepID=A0ABP7T597_9ACTN|nr:MULTISPECIES: chaplin [unclassified Streptomyces]MCX4700641.1 chaplin [Streptomyces sp. NBC_01373]